MNNTKIEWCDATWNPVTGCYHGCEYCYARRIAERFGALDKAKMFYDGYPFMYRTGRALHELDYQAISPPDRKEPYPFNFEPTFHRYKLDEPQHWRKPRTVFVCSMADLFGAWVPDEWIEAVFDACERAPQHRYIFLTKNPDRYQELAEAGKLPADRRYWYGATVTNGCQKVFLKGVRYHTFLSVEPLLGPLDIRQEACARVALFIIGAETGNRQGKVTPKKEWIDHICAVADRTRTPVFMKDSLIPIVGEANMRRELPWRG